jgi:MSHA biogenesis protein MshO
MKSRGFTLVELVVVITIAAVVAAFVVMFLTTPVESYFAQSRRADLVDSADRILRNVTGDVRSALPNSARRTAAGTVVALEMLTTTGMARYYGSGDKSYLAPAQQAQQALEELSIGQLDNAFYTLDLFAAVPGGNYLAVNNPASPPDAYAFGGVMTPWPPTFTITPNAATGEEQITLTGGGFNFATASATHSLFLVSGPVSYLCDTGAQTVQRYSNYTIAASQSAVSTDSQLMTAGATRSLLAQNVSACSINIVQAPPSAKFGQLVILSITLANSGESLQVFHEIATSYTP